jgi:endonuclease/exonuclease/phosphatase family metal-dependent hydrolase
MNLMCKRTSIAALTLSLFILFGGCRPPSYTAQVQATDSVETITLATWNVRGYPETRAEDRAWFTGTLSNMAPDVLCIQEIANQSKVDTFLLTETRFIAAAFQDSTDGQDNAVFADGQVEMGDMPDPSGFQHPAQAAYVTCKGFDAVVVSIHLSWTDTAMRAHEKALLKDVVTRMLAIDPDVILAGDFNTGEQDIQELAAGLGMQVMVPSGQAGVGTTHAGNRYDHFLISPDLASEEAVSCHIVTFSGSDLEAAKRVSDHVPVQAVFRVDGRFRDRN